MASPRRYGDAPLPHARHRQKLHAAVLQAADEGWEPQSRPTTWNWSGARWGSSAWVESEAAGQARPLRVRYARGGDGCEAGAKPDGVAELHDPSWFPTMATQVDVLVAAAPHTPITERMFNEQIFRSMKKTAYFLALSRGKLYDDMALVKALKEGWIAGAGLDVFPIEPPPSTIRSSTAKRGDDRPYFGLESRPADPVRGRLRRERPAVHKGTAVNESCRQASRVLVEHLTIGQRGADLRDRLLADAAVLEVERA